MINGNPPKMDDLGVSWGIPILGNLHVIGSLVGQGQAHSVGNIFCSDDVDTLVGPSSQP